MDSQMEDSITAHFKAILDALSDGVYISDTSGKTLFANRMYEQMTGLKREELEGRSVTDLIRSGVFDSALNPEIVRTCKPMSRVQRVNDGKTLFSSGFPIFDGNGELCLVVTFCRDVSNLASLNEQVSRQRALLREAAGQLAYIAKLQKDSYFLPPCASPQMAEVRRLVERIAPTDCTVLIQGETGTLKEAVAHMLHDQSARGGKLLVKVDCGGLSGTGFETELFGYVSGASAETPGKGKAGCFELANGSTVFLNDIDDLPLSMQARLVRVLQDGELLRAGAVKPVKVDVRVIAATSRDLEEAVNRGTFRSALYHRLNVAVIRIPPLRERPEDIEPQALSYLEMYAGKYRKELSFTEAAMRCLRACPWSGNEYELQNLVHSMVITTSGPVITPRHLPARITGEQGWRVHFPDFVPGAGSKTLRHIMQDAEADFLVRAIERYGSVQKVSELFQVDRSTIFRKIRQKNKQTQAVSTGSAGSE